MQGWGLVARMLLCFLWLAGCVWRALWGNRVQLLDAACWCEASAGYLSVCLSDGMSICLSVGAWRQLGVSLPVWRHVCLSVGAWRQLSGCILP